MAEQKVELAYARGEDNPPLLTETIGQTLARTTEAYGENLALVDAPSGRTWTYREFRAEVLALAAGLLHIAVTRGWADRDYIRGRTSGFDEAWAVASQWLPERTEAVTGVGVPALRAAVARLATAARAGRGSGARYSSTNWSNPIPAVERGRPASCGRVR